MSKTTGRTIGACAVIAVIIAMLIPWSDKEQPITECRDKFIECWNAFIEHKNAAAIFWNNHLKAANENEKREQLSRCRDAWDRVRPFEPLGVDPRLADAIAVLKKAWLEKLAFSTQQVGARRADGDRATALSAAVNAAEQRVDSVDNQIASELGGVNQKRAE